MTSAGPEDEFRVAAARLAEAFCRLLAAACAREAGEARRDGDADAEWAALGDRWLGSGRVAP
jgi:hypothetical protein